MHSDHTRNMVSLPCRHRATGLEHRSTAPEGRKEEGRGKEVGGKEGRREGEGRDPAKKPRSGRIYGDTDMGQFHCIIKEL